MPWPTEYQQAHVDFVRFMVAARDAAGLHTTNMAWNMVEGVLHVFRRRLTTPEAILFANVLPPMVRALFVENWRPAEPVPFTSRECLTVEVKALRADHNFSPDTAISAVAQALWGCVDHARLRQALDQLPPQASEFWSTTDAPD
jgi:uncharacterized protein (DUF2267 family)